jgi:peptide deformylase
MALLDIKLMGDPVLREECAPVEEIDDDLRRLAQDMFETMYDADGVGLAAPQVGITKRLIVVDPREEDVKPRALVNPRVIEKGEETDRAEEGCLSIPGLREVVERASEVVIEAEDLDGETIRLDAAGLHARVVLHEIDHLDGVLFVDRVSPLKRKMLMKKWKKQQAAGAGKAG